MALPASHTFAANDAGSFTFPGVVLKTPGIQSITAASSLAGTITGSNSVDVTSATSNPIKVEPAPLPPPTVLSEQVVSMVNVNKKGKKVGKPVPGFRFVFSTAMSASAGLPADYHVFSTVIKRVKRKSVTIFKPVKFTTSYNQARNSVTLSVKSKHPFSKGGQITITGVTDQAGVPLNPIYAIFNIEPKANSITLGSQ